MAWKAQTAAIFIYLGRKGSDKDLRQSSKCWGHSNETFHTETGALGEDKRNGRPTGYKCLSYNEHFKLPAPEPRYTWEYWL